MCLCVFSVSGPCTDFCYIITDIDSLSAVCFPKVKTFVPDSFSSDSEVLNLCQLRSESLPESYRNKYKHFINALCHLNYSTNVILI